MTDDVPLVLWLWSQKAPRTSISLLESVANGESERSCSFEMPPIDIKYCARISKFMSHFADPTLLTPWDDNNEQQTDG